MGKSKNMSNRCGNNYPIKGFLNPKPQKVTCGKRAVLTLNFPHKIHKHAQGIVHDEAAKNHTDVLDTRDQKSMISMSRW